MEVKLLNETTLRFLGHFFLILLLHSILKLLLHICLGIVEFTDALADATHELGYFSSAKQEQYGEENKNPFTAARHAQQKENLHCK